MREQLYWNGTPVPYVAAWSSEKYSHIAPDKNAGGKDAIFLSGVRGEGVPVWGIMHEARQREVIATSRCQVCNCKLRTERVFGMDIPQTCEGNPVLREPPVCSRCVRWTIEMCPGNRRRRESGLLECFEIFESTPICTILGYVEGGTAELNQMLKPGQTCVGMNKLILTRYRRLNWFELMDAAGVA